MTFDQLIFALVTSDLPISTFTIDIALMFSSLMLFGVPLVLIMTLYQFIFALASSDLPMSAPTINTVLLLSSLLVFGIPLLLIMRSQKGKTPLVNRRTQL